MSLAASFSIQSRGPTAIRAVKRWTSRAFWARRKSR